MAEMGRDSGMQSDHSEVLIGGVEKVPILVLDYDASWPIMFREHAKKITVALGGAAMRVEHIGSTSVRGMPAKPVIDILLVVEDSGDESLYLPALEQAGYVLRVRDPADEEHRMLRTPERDMHVHVFSPGARAIGRYLVFRDRLRQSAAERMLYAKTKRDLARQDWPDMNAYADAKTEVIEGIIARNPLV